MATAKKNNTIVAEFSVLPAKATPNTQRFQQDEPEDGSRASIGSLYITKKALLPMGNTSRIRVTVEAIGGDQT